MATAGVVIVPLPGHGEEARAAVADRADVPETRGMENGSLAVVLECPSQGLTGVLEEMAALPCVQEVVLAYADYEDDLDENGHMAPPPRRSGRREDRNP